MLKIPWDCIGLIRILHSLVPDSRLWTDFLSRFLSSSEIVFLCWKLNCCNKKETDDSCCCRQQEQKIPQQFRGHVQWPAVPGTTVADTILIHRNELVSYFLFFHTDDRKIAIERASGVVIRVLTTYVTVLYANFLNIYFNCSVFNRLMRLITSYFEKGWEIQKFIRNQYCDWLSSSVHIVIFVQVLVFFLWVCTFLSQVMFFFVF